ncbi:tetratricopeptide repeat protein [Pseudomonas sp. CR3202]|uniref:tetratricopeptide repeat protein n=1 Tax=Pseudomonas sp. CR3202 TaxID=3351532 RepID=UPI003BF4199F
MSGSTLDHFPAQHLADLLPALDSLADRGLFLQAHKLAAQLGDYRQWQGPAAISIAVRLAGHLGAPRLANVLAYLAYRRHPGAAETRLRMARMLLNRRGSHRAWCFLRSFGKWLPADPGLRSEWISFQGYLQALLRDFGRSAELHAQAIALMPREPWLLVERSYSLELEDRYDEALECCEQALALEPFFRAALLQASQLEVQLGREPQAVERLLAVAGTLESSGLCRYLADLLIERRELDQAESWLERAESLEPLQEKVLSSGYAGRRCDIACLRGDHAAGLALAEAAGGPFFSAVAERLAEPRGKRCLLPVTFVRQHYMTCVPATLTALSAFWSRPVRHLEVAEEICYDGTSYQAERAWAERNGWLACEFTVDWDITRALIDRGLPFTLTVQYTGSGHLQAVVGYDEPRGTILIRDPAQPQFGECLAESLFRNQSASGPRGMLLLPTDEAHRLDGLVLPEKAIWDLYYELVSALEAHRRSDAMVALEALRDQAAGHRLAWQGQRALSWYDGRESGVLEGTEGLLELFPEDTNLVLSKANSLSLLQSRQAQLAWLADGSSVPGADVSLLVRQASLLMADASRADEARRLLLRVLGRSPHLAEAWNELASLEWDQGDRELSCALYRVAACLHDANEGYSQQYFKALRCLGRVNEGLEFLGQRQARLGARAAGPTLTLCEFIEELNDPHRCRELMESALEMRPQDPMLLLNLADFYGRIGEQELCTRTLERAEPVSNRGAWLRRSVAHDLRCSNDLKQARAWCQEAIELDPLNISLHRMHMQVLVRSEGEEAVDAYVEARSVLFPHHCGLLELQVERAQLRSLDDTEAALRRLLKSHPLHAWAIRELAVTVARLGRTDEALAICADALLIDPASSHAHSSRGFVLLQQGRREEARTAFREALSLSVDNEYSAGMLLESCNGREEALDSLAFIHAELVRQVTFGDGWLAYADQARPWLETDVLMEQLSEALQRRSDLWQLWTLVARLHARQGRMDQAEQVLLGGAERFPLLPRLFLERAQLFKDQGLHGECRSVLRESFRINPLWGPSVRLYVESLLDEPGDQLDEAEQILRDVLRRTPDNTDLRAWLVHVLCERGATQEAADEAERVLAQEPANNWVWGRFRRQSEELGQPHRPLAFARSLVGRRAGDSDAWLALAWQESSIAERETALREALRLTPRHRGANEQLADLLLEQDRFDDLRLLLDAPVWGDALPGELALFRPRALIKAGNSADAIQALEQLLQLHPMLFEGWRELADLHDNAGNHSAYVEAARQMVRLEPGVPLANGFLGHALLGNDQPEEALASFLKAFEQDPTYNFAALNAFDLQNRFGQSAAAATTISSLLDHWPEAPALVRALRHARERGDDTLKIRALDMLCTGRSGLDAWNEGLEILGGSFSDPDLGQALERAVATGDLHRNAARAWLELQDQRWTPNSLWRAFKSLLANDLRHAAKQGMLELLAERPNTDDLLARTLDECREAIGQDAITWGAATYAMVSRGRLDQMFAWMADWPQRPDVPAWGLDNLALGLRIRGKEAHAAEVSRASLARDPAGHDAMVWLAGDAAVAGQHDEMQEWLTRIGEVRLRAYVQCMLELVRGYARAVDAGDSRQALKHFRDAQHLAKVGDNKPCFRRLRRKLAWRLAFGPLTPGWWAALRYLRLRYEG